MNCGSCGEVIPADSMFCPECGSRQDSTVSGGFSPPSQQIPQFPQQQRSFDPVSGQNQRTQQQANVTQFGQVSQDTLQNMAHGLQSNTNLPPGTYPQQPLQGGYAPPGFPPQQMQGNVLPFSHTGHVNDMPNVGRGPSIASGAVPNMSNVSPLAAGGTKIAHNPSNSPTDDMVNRLAEAERAVKDERRNQWLSMNTSPASSVLANLGGGELPAHLRGGMTGSSAAADIMSGGTQKKEAPNNALLRQLSEVAIRRVARKRGVAVEAPQTKLNGDTLELNITYVDDGRVLDTAEDLTHAFEQAIQTELALKGFDLSCEITLFRSRDGKTEKVSDGEDDEDMFACEICDGLVKESDPTCPHCGAVFESEDEEPEPAPIRGGPPGPSKSGGPPGPSKTGSPPGPSKSDGPPGPSKTGGPPGPSKSGGPPGPGGGPPKGGPSGGGPPGPSKSGGPPGPGGGPPRGGPSGGGPPGPSKSGGPPGPGGGPPKGGPSGGGPPGPSKSGGPPGPGGGPPKGGPSGGGPPKGGPSGGGPPGGPKRGPPR